MERQEKGKLGEAVAARYYLNRGYWLLEHNYKTRQGELDLVLQKDAKIVIAEIKFRTSGAWYEPKEAVTPMKQTRIILAAQRYLQTHRLLEHEVRFDVVEVTPNPQGGFDVHCIMDAFQL